MRDRTAGASSDGVVGDRGGKCDAAATNANDRSEAQGFTAVELSAREDRSDVVQTTVLVRDDRVNTEDRFVEQLVMSRSSYGVRRPR